MQQILDGLHVERSLEIGCGYGRLSPWIALHSERHYGVEPSGDSLEAARRQFPDFGWVRGRAESLPFPDDSHFDLVVTWTVLQHIPDDAIAKAAKEIRRVLDPNGVLVMCEVTGGDRADHVWPRSVAEYEELFHPHSCVQSLARRVERTYGVEDVGEVMRFEA